MSENALSAQGTLVYRAPIATPTVFTVIGELRDITLPPLTLKAIETTAHNDVEESFIPGIRRKGELSFMLGYNPSIASHDELTGLTKAWKDRSIDIYKVVFPNNKQWLFSGFVSNIGPKAPVDDGLTADVTIRPTNTMTFV